LPFAEAEKIFTLVLANFGGEEGWTRCVANILKKERAS